MKKRMLKSTCAVVLSIALSVTGLNSDIIYTAAGNRETVQKEITITAAQKEEARKEDEKVREELKQTKIRKEKNKKATIVKELKDFRTRYLMYAIIMLQVIHQKHTDIQFMSMTCLTG